MTTMIFSVPKTGLKILTCPKSIGLSLLVFSLNFRFQDDYCPFAIISSRKTFRSGFGRLKDYKTWFYIIQHSLRMILIVKRIVIGSSQNTTWTSHCYFSHLSCSVPPLTLSTPSFFYILSEYSFSCYIIQEGTGLPSLYKEVIFFDCPFLTRLFVC